MAADKNPQNTAATSAPRPTTEDYEGIMKGRDHKHERPEHYALRMALGHDDLPRESPYSNLARIKPYTVGHDPIRDHRKEPVRQPHETLVETDEDDS
jgi:hypothetical protein